MKKSEKTCLQCRFFENSPKRIEEIYKGLITLGSGYGSVRCQDGICSRHDLYLGAYRHCDDFEPIQAVAEA